MELSLPFSLLVVAVSALVIGVVGTVLTRNADTLADITGLGEAFMGAVFLGACTSLPGITASVTAAHHGHASLALSNALGGIAAQTVFLSIGDLFYKHANLEHAAPSVPNMQSGALLIALLSLILLGITRPGISFGGVHLVTPVLFGVYLAGLRLVRRSHESPMWRPYITRQTKEDIPENDGGGQPVRRLWAVLAASTLLIVIAGWTLTIAAEKIAGKTGLSQSLVGGVLTAVITSLPELVTTIAAVRQGALTLAVGGVLGGNMFDTLFAAMADIVYPGGSIYGMASRRETSLLILTILMTSVLLTGLLAREEKGIANIGFESIAIIGIYLFSLGMLVTG